MIKMTELIYRKWIKALRSGNYRQITGRLRERRSKTNVGYCCLGVLCDVAKEHIEHAEHVLSTEVALPDFFEADSGSTNHKKGYFYHLRDKIQWPKGVSLKKNKGMIPPISLTSLNDEEEWNFNQIADFIELNKKHLIKIIPC